MPSAAILIANAHYQREADLECCAADLKAMTSLVETLGRYETVASVLNVDGDGFRDAIRSALVGDGPYDEIFFYYSGHGAQIGSEFYYCGTTFDAHRPNETGLAHGSLQDMLRDAEPKLLVKIIDSCASGTLLVKGNVNIVPARKEGFKNLIQIASCLEDQSSFGGEPLSEFTEAFCQACLRKSDGPVYYADIINTLRDDFLENEDQTPFFVSQGTAREKLIDDAASLKEFRERFELEWTSEADSEIVDSRDVVVAEPMSPRDLLIAAEQKMAGPEKVERFVNDLFDGIIERFSGGEFADFFDVKIQEHSDFVEPTAREFIIRVLNKETRRDNFVSAEIKRTRRKANPWEAALGSAMMAWDQEWSAHYDLKLNCRMNRAQLRFALMPKYNTLQQIVLVMTCAPSLERCYVFEIGTEHMRSDWERFDDDGREFSRRWYRMCWDDDVSGVVEKVCVALEEAARAQIEGATGRLLNE